jgi:potassium uptake TrkH family protein
VVAGFAVAVILGTVLLLLPVAREGEGRATFVEALFTATSAVCVTGLTVVDTSDHWSAFGEVVILLLIQVGGLGILTAGSMILVVAGRRIGLRGRLMAQTESRGALSPRDVRRVLTAILLVTFVVEATITAIITLRLFFGYDYAFGDALWHGVFHGVSAFNGAGFALWSDSLVRFADDPAILVPVGLGVIIGGIGFPVLFELRRNVRRPRAWSLHTKLTISTSLGLLVFGMIAFGISEWTNPRTFGALDASGKFMAAWFQSLTTRSSGFSSVDFGAMSEESWLIADMLMFVGGGSGSTAGGIKVTTFAVLVLIVVSEARGGRQAEAFGRTIPSVVLRQALSVAFVAVNVIVFATLALMAMSGLTFAECLLEAVSAASIVGLSTGITAELPTGGQLLVAALMFMGRIGTLTLVIALALQERERLYQFPEERPLIG